MVEQFQTETFILMTMGFIFAALTVYAVIIMYIRFKKLFEVKKNTTPVGFVVDTFHELVAELKEKEAELEELRKRAEHRAGVAEDYNENVLQSVPSGVITMDEVSHIVKVNSAAKSILRLNTTDSTVIGMDGRKVLKQIMDCAPDIHDTVDSNEIDSAEATVQTSGQCAYILSSGMRLWLDYSLNPLLDSSGKSIGTLLVVTDHTELKALESQAELRQRLASLGEMAAGIAHELRNSMGVITGYTRLLQKKVSPDAQETVGNVSAEVGVMDRIISDFLSFANPAEPDMADVKLKDLVNECIEKSRDGLGESTVEPMVAFEVAVPDAMKLRCDEIQLRQIFTNLINNAREAMGKESSEGKVSISARPLGLMALVEVADTGHGIDKAIVKKVFNPFFTTKEKGTGLGLALVHRIVTSHGGAVSVSATEDGTTFTISLPLVKDTSRA